MCADGDDDQSCQDYGQYHNNVSKMITAWRIITVLINDGDEENCDEMVRIIIIMNTFGSALVPPFIGPIGLTRAMMES